MRIVDITGLTVRNFGLGSEEVEATVEIRSGLLAGQTLHVTLTGHPTSLPEIQKWLYEKLEADFQQLAAEARPYADGAR